MPYALQAREAREMDKQAVLRMLTRLNPIDCPSTHFILTARALEKWLQVYRTKVALRAVAYVEGLASVTIKLAILMAFWISFILAVRDKCAFRHFTSRFWSIDRTRHHPVRASSFCPHPRDRHHQMKHGRQPITVVRQSRRRRHPSCNLNPARPSAARAPRAGRRYSPARGEREAWMPHANSTARIASGVLRALPCHSRQRSPVVPE